jgi:undecaprenyl-diphosphatase
MLRTLQELDAALFYIINVWLANPVTDAVMPVLTDDNVLRLLYGAALILMLWRGSRKLRWMVPASLLLLLLTDQASAGLLKPMIERLRPCHTFESINLLVSCGGGYAMPSAHAANSFGQAFFFSVHYERVSWYLILFAALVSISRVFVGVHYPGDIIIGALLGGIIGIIMALIFRKFEGRIAGNVSETGGEEG